MYIQGYLLQITSITINDRRSLIYEFLETGNTYIIHMNVAAIICFVPKKVVFVQLIIICVDTTVANSF